MIASVALAMPPDTRLQPAQAAPGAGFAVRPQAGPVQASENRSGARAAGQAAETRPGARAAGQAAETRPAAKAAGQAAETRPGAKAAGQGAQNRRKAPGELTEAQQAQVQKLKQIDLKVRTHELAHLGAGAGVVSGGPSFSYTRGPDGVDYATAGEVPIQSPVVPGDPEATLSRAEQVAAAALAPADPSSQDRAVAASATKIAAEARMQLTVKRTEGEGDAGTYARHLGVGQAAQTARPKPVDVRA